MAWYWIVLITVIGVHFINFLIVWVFESSHHDTDDAIPIMCFLVYYPFYFLCYPVRAIIKYNSSIGYFQKHKISRVAYLFGKRVKPMEDEE